MPLGYEEIYPAKDSLDHYIEEADGSVKVDESNRVEGPDFGSDQESLFNHARDQFNAGLGATAELYSKIDNQNAPKDPYNGAFAYDNKKSVHYVS